MWTHVSSTANQFYSENGFLHLQPYWVVKAGHQVWWKCKTVFFQLSLAPSNTFFWMIGFFLQQQQHILSLYLCFKDVNEGPHACCKPQTSSSLIRVLASTSTWTSLTAVFLQESTKATKNRDVERRTGLMDSDVERRIGFMDRHVKGIKQNWNVVCIPSSL